ncbi:helix-turn-helix domain-containing protein [Lysobacter sp. TAB13]|uniref:helix-turn-helix domain-containing protein n=1 Tax=Lysobacter sp. TAB13 TaxID=3233065 RepID=UPI003F94321D
MDTGSQHEWANALSVIDLHADELEIYSFLLEHPNSSLPAILASTGVSAVYAQQWMEHLERKGLISRSIDQQPRYRATPPDLGFGALVAKRQSDLQAVLALAGQLSQKKPLSKDALEDELTVELITGRDALVRTLEQMHHHAKQEILELDRPPYITTYEQHDTMRAPVIDRNVVFKTIVDARGLEAPGRVAHIRESISAGEQTRVFRGVPIKAAIIDRSMALVPLHLNSASDSGLLLRQSLLLDLLCAYFDMLWEQAIVFEADSGEHKPIAGPTTGELIALLASGLQDKTIAQRLRLSERTLGRHIADLQKQLNARTRFQAGWRASMRARESS